MTYKILPTKEFSKDFKKLDKQFQDRIRKKFEEVADDPARHKHLHYDLKGSCRLWIGRLRIFFLTILTSRNFIWKKLYPGIATEKLNLNGTAAEKPLKTT